MRENISLEQQNIIKEYVDLHYQETIALLKSLAVIPAPSGQEGQRAEFILRWLHGVGASEAFIDAAGNVVYPYPNAAQDGWTVIMAHMDVVCADLTSLPLREQKDRLIGPGVRDDTANLVNMLMAIQYLLSHSVTLSTGFLFVADVGEEGLGNLKGSRYIYEIYGEKIREWISLDLNYDSLITRAVGSRRYKINVCTKGGHSYNDFGEENAIVQLAGIIADLYQIETPQENAIKVTYNVGKIEGGTSVNTIAQAAWMLYEIRSESERCICDLERQLEEILARHRRENVLITSERIGVRPGNGEVDRKKQQRLEQRCLLTIAKYCEKNVICEAGSTDCNIPLAAGIPAVAVGTALGAGTHTREEWVDKESMRTGQKIALEILMSYAE